MKKFDSGYDVSKKMKNELTLPNLSKDSKSNQSHNKILEELIDDSVGSQETALAPWNKINKGEKVSFNSISPSKLKKKQ